MEPRPRVRAALAAAVLLLRALGAASATCSDCAHQSGPLSEGCPAGHFLQGPCGPPCDIPTCTPCQPGTYMDQENHRYEHCVRCRFCDEEALQMTVQNCSAVANTVCDCKPGFFRGCWDHPCKDIQEHLLCRPCTDCGSLNRRPPAACSQGQEECGACLDGFYEHNKECVSCPKITLITPGSCPKPCAAVCGWRPMFWVQVLLAALVVALLLGATLIYTSRRRQAARPVVSAEEARTETLLPLQDSALLLQDSAHTLLKLPNSRLAANNWNSGPLQTQEAPCPAVPWVKDWLPSPPLRHPSTPPRPPMPAAGREVVLQPGPQLYDVIDAVPARRWKEFVRTLGLREAEIEAVEVEVDRFRDQQYEMLKRWRQQESAGLGAVYRALERMGLDGCAEDLRGRLQRGA